MNVKTDLTEAFVIRDQFCCLKLLTSIITSSQLQDQTSSIYQYLDESKNLQVILQNIFYIPSAILEFDNTPVLSALLLKCAGNDLSKSDLSVSHAIMSDEYARNLVKESASRTTSTQQISLTIGKAAYRCAFSILDELCDLDDIKYDDGEKLPSTGQSKSVTLLMLKVASNEELREVINKTENPEQLAERLREVDVGKGFERLDNEISMKLSQLIINKNEDKSALVNFVGQTMHHVTW
ncbi:hypothetical protein MD535_05265 [Vibrio sp. ZSDZ65]|uniref:Uncharacterized protein n=1 Tax=Vibrio qingdaonensis TaxID=2829491 RepID=A0A9X3HVD3_9VIBR|nr:hypothetical protein [Vibrio qingdaonensis]MCW8345440.1 hypothetical protein [Vibrio qingdaonensis]